MGISEKKYKEALANIQELYNSMKYMSNTDALHTTMYLEKAFPELKESEDEKIRKAILTGLIDCRDAPDLGWSDFGGIPIDDCIAWLENQGQNSVWSEEDEEMLEDIRFNYEFNKSGMTEGLIEQYNKWFEKIKSLKPQSKQEWSDENKNIIEGIIEYLECFNDYDCGGEPYEEYYERFEKYIKFMESLKPQPQWKPSEEQIKDFGGALLILKLQHYAPSESLESLYEQLKKL